MRRDSLLRLVRFGAVGGLSTLLYFGVYAGLSLAGAPFVLAAVAAFVVSAACGYWLHHHWTFATKGQNARNFAGWLMLQGAVLCLNVAALALLVNIGGLDRIVAQAVLLPLIPAVTFLLSRRWVFVAPSAP